MKKYINTVKYLTPEQIFWQLRYRLYRKKLTPAKKAPALNTPEVSTCLGIDKRAFVDQTKTQLINLEKELELPVAWHDESADDLWLYNLHYFDYLNNPSVDEGVKESLVSNWVESNKFDSVGWQAYPSSLRIVNWCKWLLQKNEFDSITVTSLFNQCLELNNNIEYHISGNHILANIKALLISGLFFSGEKAAGWYQKALKLLKKELSRQILPKGGHYELTPMYHNIVLEDLIDIWNFHRIYNRPLTIDLQPTITKMLDWSAAMSHPDGGVSFFNDSALGIAPSYDELENYAKQCDIDHAKQTCLNCDGYQVVEKGPFYLLFDTAAIGANSQPGHAHADSLSFELSVNNERFFVNLGTSTYHDAVLRKRQRSTAAHNTLTLGDYNSSEVWGKFRVANRAVTQYSRHEAGGCVTIDASHDGYAPAIHSRKVQIEKNKICIFDQLTQAQEKKVAVYFYLHPDLIVSQFGNQIILCAKETTIKVDSQLPMQLIDSLFYPKFNSQTKNKCIRISAEHIACFDNEVVIEHVEP